MGLRLRRLAGVDRLLLQPGRGLDRFVDAGRGIDLGLGQQSLRFGPIPFGLGAGRA